MWKGYTKIIWNIETDIAAIGRHTEISLYRELLVIAKTRESECAYDHRCSMYIVVLISNCNHKNFLYVQSGYTSIFEMIV